MCGCEFFPQKSPGAALARFMRAFGRGLSRYVAVFRVQSQHASSILQIKGESVLLPFLLLFPFFSFVSWLG
jgi:hypothetical protein